MEKTDSALAAGFCSVVVITVRLTRERSSVQNRAETAVSFEEKYKPFALSVALRTLYLYALFPRACT